MMPSDELEPSMASTLMLFYDELELTMAPTLMMFYDYGFYSDVVL